MYNFVLDRGLNHSPRRSRSHRDCFRWRGASPNGRPLIVEMKYEIGIKKNRRSHNGSYSTDRDNNVKVESKNVVTVTAKQLDFNVKFTGNVSNCSTR